MLPTLSVLNLNAVISSPDVVNVLSFTAIFGHDLFGETLEIIFTLFGASIVSYGHLQNQKLCKLNCHS